MQAIADTRDSGSDGAAFVDCRNVHKAYGGREVLRGIDLQIRRGEVVTVMGPSGSGKSTLLRLVNHLEQLDQGSILVNGAYVGYRQVGRVAASDPRPGQARAPMRASAWCSSTSICSTT